MSDTLNTGNEQHYTLIKNYVKPQYVETLIQEALLYKRENYTEENLASHAAYLSDVQPHRTSSAFAVAPHVLSTQKLPTLEIDNYALGAATYQVLVHDLGLGSTNRALFNIQEYFSASERVPKHNDGELLEFTSDSEGNLDIKRSIRPKEVAVLTLVNDTTGGGTRLHFPDGSEEVIRGEAGDLLIFDNVICKHSVDPLEGVSKRADGLLRLIIGWRSLADRCVYAEGANVSEVTRKEAEDITVKWYETEWPAQWAAIQGSRQKAAF